MATHSLDLESGSSQYASIADASCPNLEISGSQTWECWIKPESFADFRVIMSKAVGGNTHDFYMGAAAKPVFRLAGLTTNTSVTYSGTLSAAVWVHIAGVYDSSASKLRLYVNGELDQEVTASGSAVDTNGLFRIGANDGGTYYDGLIRNARVWSVARTQAQIRADMNVDTPSVTTGLVSNWKLNNDYVDAVSAYNLTASGSPTFATVYPDALALTENLVYTKKHKIVVQHGQVAGSADLTDVPIVLTEANFLNSIFDNSLNGGADIRFSSDIDGKIRLAHEVVSWVTASDTGEIWVKANTLDYDNDTDIYVHYGYASATAIDENEAFGKHQVWGTSWDVMYHLQTSAVDSTNVSNDGTEGTITHGASYGKIKQGALFNGSSSYIDLVAYPIAGSQSFTFGAWFKTASTGSDITIAQIGNPITSVQGLTIYKRSTEKFGWDLSASGGTNSTTSVSDDAWHFGIVRNNAGTFAVILDGVAEGGNSSKSPNITTGIKRLGAQGSSSYFSGSMDNVFVYAGALSDDYIVTLYNNQNSPSTFAIPQSLSNASNFFLFL